MDLIGIASHRFEQLAPALAAGMTPALSDDVEAWLRGPVCGATSHLMRKARFRAFALWSTDRLGRGATTPERKAVEAVDDALTRAAAATADALRELALPPAPGPGAAEPQIVWLARRPWFDLVLAGEDYFGGGPGLAATPSRADLWGTFYRPPDPRVPLGDYVARAMFRRVEVLTGVLTRAWDDAFWGAQGRGAAGHALAGRLFGVKVELDAAVDALRAVCHRGDEARLRDACCALVQVAAGYDPAPDLGWLAHPQWPSPGITSIIRSRVRAPGEHTTVPPGPGGGVRVVGRERVPLCLPEVAAGVAAALAAVAPLYRRPADPDALVDWLRAERRLVLVDRRPRAVYWAGAEVAADWDGNPKAWDLLWAVGQAAKRGRPASRDEVAGGDPGGDAVKHRRSRLKNLIPGGMNALIKAVPGGYWLTVPAGEIALLRVGADAELVEVGEDQVPGAADLF